MPKTKQWIVFYVAIGVGIIWGIMGYLAFFSAAHKIVHNPVIGILIAVAFGLAIGFASYPFFKLTLRTFTWSFLRRAQALTTLERLDLFSEIAGEIVATLEPQKTLGRIVATAIETLPIKG